jgi:hypothetical protein
MPSDFASLGSFLLCHWSHLGFFIVRLPEVTSSSRYLGRESSSHDIVST